MQDYHLQMPNLELILIPILVLVVAGGVGLTFLRILRRSNALLPEEEGRTPLHLVRTGGRIGRLRYNGPFARVAIYEDLLVVAAAQSLALRPADLERITFGRTPGSGTFGRTINLFHRLKEVRSPVCLYSSQGKLLAERIGAALHVSVQEA